MFSLLGDTSMSDDTFPLKVLSLANKLSWPYWLVLSFLLLPGRYDWSGPNRAPSWRGLLCSAFFLCLIIPLLSSLLHRAGGLTAWCQPILGMVALLLSLPYRWVGLDRLYYHRDKPIWLGWKNPGLLPPKLLWFPQALSGPASIPGEKIFFFGLAGTILLAWGLYIRVRIRRGRPLGQSTVIFGVALVALIVAETWLHISLRSPYTYICHFEQPPAANYWYHALLFSNGQGAVNADYFVFRALEEVFLGTPQPLNGMLIRRPFPMYISSQFSYFFNPYYVMLVMNVLLWLAAALAVRDYVAAHVSTSAASIAALLTASAPGFIMYVAQPQTYLWGFGAVAIIVWAHWRLCGHPKATIRDYILFGGILALAFLTYDLFSLLVYLIAYDLLFSRRFQGIAVAAVIAMTVYVAFGVLTGPMNSITHDIKNSKYLGIALSNTFEVVRSFPLRLGTYSLYLQVVPNYIRNLSNTVFVFPLLLAAIGLFMIKRSGRLQLLGLLALPSIVNYAFLYLGQTELAVSPRFEFIGYLAVYIACGIALAAVAQWIGRYAPRVALLATIGAITLHILLTNADVFGFPWLYYMFYYQTAAPANF